MKLYNKKKIDIIVEVVYAEKVLEIIEKSGASGYTVYQGIIGKGRHGMKDGTNGLNQISGNVEVITIAGEEVALRILEELQRMMEDDIVLIVHLSDVQVIRNKHFN